ncbi:MAG: hypothetical protein ACE15E_03210 [Acidobacteriota bacterium]
MRNRFVSFLLATVAGCMAAGCLAASARAQPQTSPYRYHQDFTVTETAGVPRSGQPVLFRLKTTVDSPELGTFMLWDRTNRRQVPAQLTVRADTGAELLFVANQPAHRTVDYRLYYGGPKSDPVKSERIKVCGEDLAWQVENEHFVVDFSRNPGTGRSGQINRIFVKRPGLWLSRERDQSTLHLSPNGAGRQHYLPVNRWDPPERWTWTTGPVSFRLERSGPMPRLPELRAQIMYEVFADSRLILVEEKVEARNAVDLTLLRLGEFTFAPDPKTPFTNLIWGNAGRAFEAGRNEKPDLPVDVAWLGFVCRPGDYGFVSVLDQLETSGPTGGPAPLMNPVARFSGNPAHYFWRAFITNDSGEQGPALSVAAGTRYRLKHWLYWLEPGDPDPLKALCDVWKAIKNPLQAAEGPARSNRAASGAFSAKRAGSVPTVRPQGSNNPKPTRVRPLTPAKDAALAALLDLEARSGVDKTLRALHWLGRDFSFLFPGEDGAKLRAVARELELAANLLGQPRIQELLGKAENVLKRYKFARPIDLSGVGHAVSQTVEVNLGCGPSPVVLEINSPGFATDITSREVTLAPASSQTQLIDLEPAGRIWLVLRVSGRPEGGESRRLRLAVGGEAAVVLLRSNQTPLSTTRVLFNDAATNRKIPVAVRLYDGSGRLILPPGALDFRKLGYLSRRGVRCTTPTGAQPVCGPWTHISALRFSGAARSLIRPVSMSMES